MHMTFAKQSSSKNNAVGPATNAPDADSGDVAASVPPIVVGIGASAGGHEALEQLFTMLPADCCLAFVVVMHLPADGPSLLADILKRHTSLQVVTAEDGIPLRPNTIHVCPPDKDLTVRDGRLRLHSRSKQLLPHHPIDRFFSALAEDFGERAVAVVLSGFGADGSEGVMRIKESGGIVLVQSPETATNPFMPQNAVDTGAADLILPMEEIADRLAHISRGDIFFQTTLEDDLKSLFSMLEAKTSHDFSSYRRNTVLRRIKRRMAVNGAKELNEYLALLEQTPQEAHALCQELLIGVTSFFRDPDAFEILRSKIIPLLFANRDPEQPVRIWHACCATGEEAYSVAMLIIEHLETEKLPTKVQIFATDLDEAAVAQARAGAYADEVAHGISEERLKRFFVRNEGCWQVTKQLREMVVFAQHNIIKDPPFSRLDLLVCRNFLIYLNPNIQRLLIPLFHQVLNPRGFLFLGSAETVGIHNDLFTPFEKKWKIFMRQVGKSRVETLFPFSGPVRKLADIEHSIQSTEPQKTATIAHADKLLMERYVPARIIINEKNEVVHFSSRAGAYLLTPEGEPTRDLLKIAKEELRPALRAAIYKAFTTNKEIAYQGVKTAADSGETTVNIVVVPLNEPPPAGKQALVIIEPALHYPVVPTSRTEVEGPGDDASGNALTRQLEEQLRVTSEQLHSTCEQLETSNERFMLANEELMTVNEELQSTNEELQSTNEELVTVNSELQRKMEELNQSNSDLENLFASSEIAAFFLDREMLLKRFSPAMADIFNLIPADVGRPMHHFNSIIDWLNLSTDANSVLETLTPIEREVRTRNDDRSFIMRVLPYKTMEGIIDGIVVTLVDISERKQAEQALYASEKALREGDERLRFALETCHIGAWDMDMADQVAYRSPEHSRIFGYAEMLPQWTFAMFIGHVLPEDRDGVEQLIRQGLAAHQGWNFECRIRRVDGAIRWIWVAGRPNVDKFGNNRMTGVVQDITDRKKIEAENRQLLEEVQQDKDRLSALIDSISEEVWFADTEKKFTLANPSAHRTFGIDVGDDIDIKQFAAGLQVFRADGSPRPIEESPSLRALRGEAVKNLEEIVRNPVTGELRHREVHANPVRDAHGEIIGSVAVVRDITDRKLAEEAVRESRAKLEAALSSMTDAVFISDTSGRFIEINDAFAAFHRFENKAACLQRLADYPEILEVFTPDGELTPLDMWAVPRALRGETVANAEYSLRRKDTGETWVGSYSFSPIRDKQGMIVGSVVVGRDVTELKRKEEALRQSEVQYHTLFDTLIEGFCTIEMIFDADGKPVDYRFLEVNPAFEQLTGLHDVQGRTMRELVPENEDYWYAMYGKVVLTGEPVRFESETKALGSYFDVCAYRIGGPESRKVAILFNNITERKRAEEALVLSEQRRSLALEAAQAGTWEWDLESNENVWSNEVWLLYGLEPYSCIPSYAAWLQTVHPDDRAKVESAIHEAVAHGLAFTAEWRVIFRDGSERWLMARGRPLNNSCDQIVRYLGTVMDVTERKHAEEEKKALQAQLIHAQKMEAIGTLAGGIAHDFNNILGAVIGYAEMAREDSPADSRIAHDLDRVLEASGRATNLVKQILAFSRDASAERIPLEPVHLVKEAIKLLRPALPSTITIKQHLGGATSPILADPTQIHQIVMNLCTNAFHAMEQNGGILDISLKDCTLSPVDLPFQANAHAGKYVVLSISDTGPGILPEIKGKIFEPYFTTKEIGKGTGMGLSIIHGIVTSMDGWIRCESEPGQGATFHVYFPAAEREAASAALPVEPFMSGKERILFIDDEDILVEMGKIMLERLGYKVTVRTSSIEALAHFQNNPDQFDAVVTDQTMPGMTGFDLARRMLQIRPDLPIILCTGYSHLVDEEQAKMIGVKGFIMKPMSKKDIGTLLKVVLEKQ
jgi:two-component system CheB/CheR fusion protein